MTTKFQFIGLGIKAVLESSKTKHIVWIGLLVALIIFLVISMGCASSPGSGGFQSPKPLDVVSSSGRSGPGEGQPGTSPDQENSLHRGDSEPGFSPSPPSDLSESNHGSNDLWWNTGRGGSDRGVSVLGSVSTGTNSNSPGLALSTPEQDEKERVRMSTFLGSFNFGNFLENWFICLVGVVIGWVSAPLLNALYKRLLGKAKK